MFQDPMTWCDKNIGSYLLNYNHLQITIMASIKFTFNDNSRQNKT